MTGPTLIKLVVSWIVLAILGVATLTWVQPKAYRKASRHLAELQARLNRAEDGAAELRALAEQLESELAIAEGEVKRIPVKSHFATLIGDFGQRLDAQGVSDREITNGGAVDLDVAMSVPMRIRLETGFREVFSSIQWIESLPRLVRVQRVVIETTDKDDPWFANVTAELTLDVIFDPNGIDEIGADLVSVDAEATRR